MNKTVHGADQRTFITGKFTTNSRMPITLGAAMSLTITQQHAPKFFDEMRRIWKPMRIVRYVIHRFHIEAMLDKETLLIVSQEESGVRFKIWNAGASLTFDSDNVLYGVGDQGDEKKKQFVERWLEIFRRNCYLSGADIECTGHEKIVWNEWLKAQPPIG